MARTASVNRVSQKGRGLGVFGKQVFCGDRLVISFPSLESGVEARAVVFFAAGRK